MQDDRKQNSSSIGAGMALGAGIGTALGAGIGVALGDIGLGIGVGLPIGTALGMTYGMFKSASKQSEEPPCKNKSDE